MIKRLLALLGLSSMMSCNSPTTQPFASLAEYKKPSSPMTLIIYSEYGSKETLRLPNPSEKDVTDWMTKLDWNQFHQVILTHGGGETDYMEVGGSLKPSDGFSGLVSLTGAQFVTPSAPPSVDHMTALIISYYRNDEKWKAAFK